MNLVSNSYISIEQLADTYLKGRSTDNKDVGKETVSFQDTLNNVYSSNRGNDVVFSKHASQRLASRNIQLDHNQMERLNQGIEQAKEKSIKESLVMMDNIAFIVNVKNGLVITAMDQESNDSNVFTNIDGAVIVQPDLREAIIPWNDRKGIFVKRLGGRKL